MNPQKNPRGSSGLSESVNYLSEHLPELQQGFAGMWVALAGRTVKLSSSDLDDLQKQIEANYPHDSLLIDYIPLPDEVLDWK